MKKGILLIIIGVVILFLSVLFFINGFGFNKKINVTDTREFNEDIKSIQLDASYDVDLIPSDTQKIEVYATDDAMRRVKTEVKDNVLVIYEDNWSWIFSDKVIVKVFYTQLDKIILNGSGNISNHNILEIQNLDLVLNGSGNIDINTSSENISTNLTGSGNVNIFGSTKQHQVDMFGSGNYSSFALESDFSKLIVAGSGNAYINAKKTLVANITGSGNIFYKGEPQIIEAITESGKIIESK